MKTALCRSCNQPVIWAVNNVTKRRAPIDAVPVADGNIVFTHEPGQGGDPEYRIPSRQELDVFATMPDVARYTNHFATCPHAKQHAKGTRR
jgi:hypothetical protein